jgi:hypothetical protein
MIKETSKEWLINNFGTKYWVYNLRRALVNHPKLTGDVPKDIIETGTCHGLITKIWSFQFDQVTTIETVPELWATAVKYSSNRPNIKFVFGDSLATLRATLHLYEQRLVFFLNSNFNLTSSLEEELKAIKDCHKRADPIIIIDESQNTNLSLDSIHQLVMAISSEYVLEFLPFGTGIYLCYPQKKT